MNYKYYETFDKIPTDELLNTPCNIMAERLGVGTTTVTNYISYRLNQKKLNNDESKMDCYGAWSELKETQLYKQLINKKNGSKRKSI